MVSTKLTSLSLAASFVSILSVLPAQAQSPRTFVSAAGNDSNPCTFAAPCRHFQNAVNVTSVGGEVDALDPAGYGPITITHAVTIEGQGWSYIAPPAGGNGITINAGSGNVAIHGVSINGVGITAPTNGIVFNSGGSLTITNCVLQNFIDNVVTNSGNGIYIAPSAGPLTFTITNTTVANNTQNGIFYLPQGGSFNASGVIDHVVAEANMNGIDIVTNAVTGGTQVIAVSNSIVSSNSSVGLNASQNGSLTLKVSIDNVNASGNSFQGISASGNTSVVLGRSVVTGNGSAGIGNGTSPSNTFYTYQNNEIDLNGTDVFGAALNTTKPMR